MARARALDALRIAELREKATAAGMSGTDRMGKGELIEALRSGESLSTSGRFRRSTTDVLTVLKADHAKVARLFGEAVVKAHADAAAKERRDARPLAPSESGEAGKRFAALDRLPMDSAERSAN